MVKKILLFSLLLFLFHAASAQFFVRGGYAIGRTNPKEINKLIYIHNELNSQYYATGKKMPEIKTFGGLAIAMGVEDEGFGWELQWQNRHDVVKSEFMFNNENVKRNLKIRSNMLSLGFYGGSEHVSFGGSLDMGNFKGFYKRTPTAPGDKSGYQYIFQTKQEFSGSTGEKDKNILRTLQIGCTVFTQFTAGPLGGRLFYQWQFMNMNIDDMDNRFVGRDLQFGADLEDHLNNVGVMLFLKIGGYKD